MAKLSFYARGDQLVTVPGVYPQIGQALPTLPAFAIECPFD
jgi:hypothetical protein